MYITRELTLYNMQVLNNDLPKSPEVLGDIVTNSVYNTSALQYLYKKETSKKHLWSVYFFYREHMMG